MKIPRSALAILIGAAIVLSLGMGLRQSLGIFMPKHHARHPCARGRVRSTVLGMVSAAGSLGAMIAAPIGQTLMQAQDWRWGVAGIVVLSLFMIPAALFAGRIDRVADAPTTGASDDKSAAACCLPTRRGRSASAWACCSG